jgi:NRPS condensation-like uncharacterized protein
MRSILLAYAGEDDPTPAEDVLSVRDLRALAGAASLQDRVVRARALARHAARGLVPPARVAEHGRDGRAGYGFELMPFTAAETAAAFARRTGAATVNDVLMAALAVTIRRWNEHRGRPARRIALTMPVNIRPAGWRHEVVGNYATFVTVSLSARESRSLAAALAVTASHTRRIKRQRLGGIVVDLLDGARMVPVGAKRRLPELIAMTGHQAVDTANLSNLGVLEGFPAPGGDAGRLDAVWFSPPSRMPLGTALGVATFDGRLHVTLRHRHPQLDGAGARAFAELYRDVMLH